MKIAVIGAGPRGILTTGEFFNRFADGEVYLFDPCKVGGQTWQTTQDKNLVMNTPAGQIQQFATSPTLAEWCQNFASDFISNTDEISDDLIEDAQRVIETTYPSRRLYGAYLKACFKAVPHQKQIHLISKTVDNINPVGDHVDISVDGKSLSFDSAIITINNGQNNPNSSEQALIKYGKVHDLYYVRPIQEVSKVDFNQVPAQKDVIIRGLGLTFNDVITQLTQKRGGEFYRDANDDLQYNPSGKEPHVIAGSRRGLPPYPKLLPQSDDSHSVKPRFLTANNIKELVVNKSQPDNYHAFIQLLRLEIEFRYYSNLIKKNHPEIDLKTFQHEFIVNKQVPKVLPAAENINWDKVKNPVAGEKITTVANYQNIVLNWLQQTYTDSQRGKNAILIKALDTTHELRSTIKALYINPQISTDSFKNDFLNDFSGTNAFLASGAPSFRFEQMMALMRAKVLTILPPQMKVAGGNGHFLALSMFYPKEVFQATTLIEARIPSINLMGSKNPLIHNLDKSGLLTNPIIHVDDKNLKIRCANVNLNYQVINSQSQVIKNIYLVSQLLEGERWLTNVCPRRGDDANRKAVQKIIATL